MTEQQENVTKATSGRTVFSLILGIPTVIILLSTLLYYLVESKSIDLGTVNSGELITPPVRLTDFKITTINKELYRYDKPKPKWTFVVFGGQDCNASCEKMLYLSRQSNIALAKKMNRIRRFYISYEQGISPLFQQHIDQHYKDLSVLFMSKKSIERLFANTGVDPFLDNRFFVVDQRGWLMMYYSAASNDEQALNALGKDVIKDMRRLIK